MELAQTILERLEGPWLAIAVAALLVIGWGPMLRWRRYLNVRAEAATQQAFADMAKSRLDRERAEQDLKILQEQADNLRRLDYIPPNIADRSR